MTWGGDGASVRRLGRAGIGGVWLGFLPWAATFIPRGENEWTDEIPSETRSDGHEPHIAVDAL
jgi:hypothetical protein